MAKRRKEKKYYTYECTLTGEPYKLTAKADDPDNLVSVQGYYELNPDKDDRPEVIKIQLGVGENQESSTGKDNTDIEENGEN